MAEEAKKTMFVDIIFLLKSLSRYFKHDCHNLLKFKF